MAIEPEKGGKLAHERLQFALPVRAKTRRQPSSLMGSQSCSAVSNVALNARGSELSAGEAERSGKREYCAVFNEALPVQQRLPQR
jgi:hypothetical protein